jgi:Tol biopolymer transport system component
VLLIARPDGIVEFDIEDGAEQTLLAPGANEFLLDPAVSPDGARLAYIVQPPPKIEGGVYDAGSDLWVAGRDGSEPHLVFEHVDPNQLVRFPQWRDDNRVLAIVIETVQREGQTMVVYTLQEIDSTTGSRRTMREDVIAFAISPDGERVAYAELAPRVGETLRTAALDGGEPQTLVSIEDNLSPFASPDYSPDGQRVAFASADQTGVRAECATYRWPAPAPLTVSRRTSG